MVEVGIFFFVNSVVISEKAKLDRALSNELFIEHGEHYSFWLEYEPQTDAGRHFKSHAYDYFPRGRVVFDRKRSVFYLYVDRCLSKECIIGLTHHFGLPQGQVKMRRDEHYQCINCSRCYIDDYS